MADARNPQRGDKHTEAWQDKPWKYFQRVVFRLQKRIYRAQQRHDRRTGHKLHGSCTRRVPRSQSRWPRLHH
jgi:hypothetical protein